MSVSAATTPVVDKKYFHSSSGWMMHSSSLLFVKNKRSIRGGHTDACREGPSCPGPIPTDLANLWDSDLISLRCGLWFWLSQIPRVILGVTKFENHLLTARRTESRFKRRLMSEEDAARPGSGWHVGPVDSGFRSSILVTVHWLCLPPSWF